MKSFCDFCKNNIPLLIATTLVLFFCYGIKLFQYSIGIDTELFMVDKSDILEWYISIGRFGFSLLAWLLDIKEFNPFTAFLSAFFIIWLFTISWAYIIALFCKDTGKNNALIPFVLVFASSPIWAEQFYFVLQAREVALMVLLCPYAIYAMFIGFMENKKNKIILAFLSFIFMTSVYQAMVPFFCCGIFICFMLFVENSDYEQKIYRNLGLKIFGMLVCAMVVYVIIDKILMPSNMEKVPSFYDMYKWGRLSIKENILRILLFAYTLTIGNIQQIQDITNPIIASHANSGMEAAKSIANISKVSGNILLLPLTMLFIIKCIEISRKRILYVIAAICVPLSIMFLAILGGNVPPVRSIYVLPLAFAFMFFFLIKNYSKKFSIAIICLALLTVAYQSQITAQLFYSDQLRYNEDVRLAYEIHNQLGDENLPIAIIGKYRIAEKFHANFLQGDVIGHSFFEWGDIKEARGLNFMHCLGINFNAPNDEQMERAISEAVYMPSYPNPGYIKKLPDMVVVKLLNYPP